MLQTVRLADCLNQSAGTLYAHTKYHRFWLVVLKCHVWGREERGLPNSARERDGERASSDILTLWYQQPPGPTKSLRHLLKINSYYQPVAQIFPLLLTWKMSPCFHGGAGFTWTPDWPWLKTPEKSLCVPAPCALTAGALFHHAAGLAVMEVTRCCSCCAPGTDVLAEATVGSSSHHCSFHRAAFCLL